jgi:O-antigen/teichoic acid export membrane protein
MLLISGLDTAVVAHFDFKATGYYAVAASPTNFIILLMGAIFGPLLPAVSGLAAIGDHAGIASLTLRTTRICALLLLLLGLPLLLYGYPILSLWVGADYARHSAALLEILVVASLIRLCVLPYSVILIGNGLQRYGFLGALTEAFINLSVSIVLGSRYGAIGVAIGTLAGGVVGIALHIFYSMRCTFAAIPVSRREFLLQGLARPLVCAVPLIGYLLFCRGNPAAYGFTPPALIILLSTMTIWNIGLTDLDRKQFGSAIRDRLLNRAVRA